MLKFILACFFIWCTFTEKCIGISSPVERFTTYKHSTELQKDVADLWWTVDDAEKEIVFELHVKSTGWIALGISPAGGMKDADIAVGWIESNGEVYIQDRYSSGYTRPVIDNTTQDWFVVQGREANGWTTIQFKRLLDTCDPMDVPIKSGTNILIFAYGLYDLDINRPEIDVTYHELRRNSRIIPLRYYTDPPPDEKFLGLDTFEFRLNNYLVPSNDTTYHCKIYKIPSGYPLKRHAIAYKILIDPRNEDLVHHLDLNECDPTVHFDDQNLPEGLCDEITDQIKWCATNFATIWAVGGDRLREFPEEAGFAIAGDFEVNYYMVQMHYDNPRLHSNRHDSSGIRFYLGNNLRSHDLGFLTFGVGASPYGISIPPKVDKFLIDSYCPSEVTQNIPKTGITVLFALPHTHLQGVSVWTKIIRNNTAVQYLFNGDSYNFNYQYQNRLPKPIKLFPGDSFATRCVYSTTNKNEMTFGGERTRDEMCLNMFTYYPRMNDLYACVTLNTLSSWQNLMDRTEPVDTKQVKEWASKQEWNTESIMKWQQFYHNASRVVVYGKSENYKLIDLPNLPNYKDLEPDVCKR